MRRESLKTSRAHLKNASGAAESSLMSESRGNFQLWSPIVWQAYESFEAMQIRVQPSSGVYSDATFFRPAFYFCRYLCRELLTRYLDRSALLEVFDSGRLCHQ